MSLNKYINLMRIEYVITNACTSSCRHCSAAGSGDSFKLPVQMDAAVTVIRELSAYYKLESIMTFGGEPLLYPETVCAIHNAAMAMDIPKRQVITNGFFSKDLDKINSVAKALKACGVNSLLLSVDAFHKEFLPIDKVYAFAKAACKEKIEGFKLQPAWVIDNSYNNSYNKLTYECLEYFTALNIPVNQGNNIFPSGNAAVYLSEFYEKKPIDLDYKCGTAPYTSRLDMVDCISIAPDGDVEVCCFTIGNIYKDSISDIIKSYDPYSIPPMDALLRGGLKELIRYAKSIGIRFDAARHYSACGICSEIVRSFRKTGYREKMVKPTVLPK